MWDDIKEIYLFRCGWFIPVMMWIITLLMFGLIGLLIYAPFETAAVNREMAEQHCVKTGEQKNKTWNNVDADW